MRAYTAAAGRTRVPPPSQFALIKWRDEVRGPGEVMDDIAQLQSRGIPIGWVLLDNPWEVGSASLATSSDCSTTRAGSPTLRA